MHPMHPMNPEAFVRLFQLEHDHRVAKMVRSRMHIAKRKR